MLTEQCQLELCANQIGIVIDVIMKFLKQLFGKGEVPVDQWRHETLGEFTWDDDYEAWRGQVANLEILLAYERQSPTPPDPVVDLAVRLFDNLDELYRQVERLKLDAHSDFGETFHSEIDALKLERIFIVDGEKALISFAGGKGQRSWRTAIEGTRYFGLSFDS